MRKYEAEVEEKPEEFETQTPFTKRHPPVRLIPFAKVEVAVVEVEIKTPAVALLPRRDEPSTESFAPGVVVPSPKKFDVLMTSFKFPAAL